MIKKFVFSCCVIMKATRKIPKFSVDEEILITMRIRVFGDFNFLVYRHRWDKKEPNYNLCIFLKQESEQISNKFFYSGR